MKPSTQLVIIAAGLGGLAFVLYRGGARVVQAAGDAANAINPLNDQNVFASSVDKVGAKLSGDSSWSLGTWIYDVTHPAAPADTASAPALNYASPANDSSAQAMPGDPPALSFLSGQSFKDLADPYAVNPFTPLTFWDLSGGGH